MFLLLPNGIVSLSFFSSISFSVMIPCLFSSYVCVCVCFFVLSFCRFPRWWWWCFVIWNLHNAQPLCKILLSLSHSYRIQMNRFVSTATRIIPWCDTWMELHNYAKKNEECTSTIATTTITTIATIATSPAWWWLRMGWYFMWAPYAFRLAIRYPFCTNPLVL